MKSNATVTVDAGFWEHCRLALDVARDYRLQRRPAVEGFSIAAERRYKKFCRGEDALVREAMVAARRGKLRRVK